MDTLSPLGIASIAVRCQKLCPKHLHVYKHEVAMKLLTLVSNPVYLLAMM
jgi:hypothetical protein